MINIFQFCKLYSVSDRDYTVLSKMYKNTTKLENEWVDELKNKIIFKIPEKNITFVENTEYAKYLRITTEDKVTKKQIEGNIVDLLYTKDYGSLGNVRKLEYIQSMNPLRVSSNFTNALNYNNVETSKEMDISSKSNEDILREYINVISIPKHIKKNALNSIIERFIKEIKDKSPL